jgi:hypothetical protein
MKPKQGFLLWKPKDIYGLVSLAFVGFYILNLLYKLFPLEIFYPLLMGAFLTFVVILDSTVSFQKTSDLENEIIVSFWGIKISKWAVSFLSYMLLIIVIGVLVQKVVLRNILDICTAFFFAFFLNFKK